MEKKRRTKEEIYKKERENIIIELEEILGLNEYNRKILLEELEKNEKLKEKLREKREEIKKMWSVSTWGYYSNDIKKGKDNEITLLRSVFKNSGYNIISKRKTIKREEKKRIELELYFYK